MDFELTEDQRDLADGIRKLCAGRFPLEQIRAAEATGEIDLAAWAELHEAGVFSIRRPEVDGGLELGMAECAVVFEELGRALVPGPLVATQLASGWANRAAANGNPARNVVGLIERPPAGSAIPGLVEHLSSLDTLLVLDDDGVWSVDPSALDATRIERPMDPLTPMWRVERLPIGDRVGDVSVTTTWRRDGAVLTAALQIGLAAVVTELAVAYAKEREQFGRPIGSFQAIKHLCADMVVRTEVARAAVHAAAVTLDQPGVGDELVAAAGAKLLADEAALLNGKSCIQVYGGMGFTWEVPAHLYYKRARVLATTFGTVDAHAESIAERLASRA